MGNTIEMQSREAQERDKFRRKVCIGCAFYREDSNVGFGLHGGHCDHLGMTGRSRILNTPPEQLGKSCPLRRTPREWAREKAIIREERMDRLYPKEPTPRGRRPKMGQIEVARTNGEVIGVFANIKEAAAVTGVPGRKIYKLVHGELKSNDTGYIFREAEDDRSE